MKSWQAIEEVAKFEQRMEAKRGKSMSLKNTIAISSLSKQEKEEFIKWKKKKSRNKKMYFVAIFSIIVIGIILRPEITGNIIIEDHQTTNLASIFIAASIVSVLLINLFLNLREKKRIRKYQEHMKIAEDYL